MRLAIITTMASAPWGGSEYLWSEMAKQAIRAGHEVALFVYHWPQPAGPVAELASQGAQVHTRRRGVRSRLEWMFPKLVAPLSFRALGNWRPDVVCINMGSAYDAVMGGVWAIAEQLHETAGVPYVTISHGVHDKILAGLSDKHRERGRRYFGRAAKACFLSQVEIAMMERQLAMHLPKAVVYRNPVKLADRSVVPWPADETLRMAYIARLHAGDKGHDVLLEVLAQEAWRARPWQLNIYGEGPSRGYYEQLARLYRIQDQVHFKGYEENMRKVWAENHLHVMSSRSEGVSLAHVEAMFCGRPAVVTDVGGMREWLVEGETGFLAHAATPLSFGEALERAWRERARLPQMGEAAHALAGQMADLDAANSLLKLLEHAAQPPALRVAA